MVQVIINWIYITLTSYTLGYAIYRLLYRNLSSDRDSIPAEGENPLIKIFLGLAAVTVYAEVWSLFGGVGLAANIVLIFATTGLLFLYGKNIGQDINHYLSPAMSSPKGRTEACVYLIITVIVAYGTSRGYMHIDTNLYHAQAIRRIEEYGSVPGLANPHGRFGYNCAEFALNALYSMRWIFGQSLHATAGYFVLMGAYLAADIKKVFRFREKPYIRLSDPLRIGLIFYLCKIFIEMVAPASDYYAQTLMFIILILWLDALDDSKDFVSVCAMLSILMVYAVTIKLSIGLLVLIAVAPAVLLIKNKNIKGIVASILSGLVISLPFFIRNVIISGRILYPSTAFDIFDVDWKISREEAIFDRQEIGLYGKGYIDMSHVEDPMRVWVPNWFSGLHNLEKLWALATAAALIAAVVYIVLQLLKKKEADWNRVLLIVTFSAGTLFWFTQAPLIRYGYAYIIIMPAFVFGMIYTDMLKYIKNGPINNILTGAFLVGSALFLLSRAYNLATDIRITAGDEYYVNQQDYDDGEAFTYEVDGVTIYVANDSGQIGYNKFPSSPFVVDDLHLRGEDIKDGFIRY